MSGAPTCGQFLVQVTERLRAAGISSARLDARVLMAHALNINSMAIFSHPERPLSEDEIRSVEALTARREKREPVSHILGRREFWSLNFAVTADTLDPRPDTETLIETVLDAVSDRQARLKLLDFGTGTGCIPLTLLSELPNARALAVDISPAALAVARKNAISLALDSRIAFLKGDWGQGLDGVFDIITSNPPYIPDAEIDGLEAEVAAWEPRNALAGGSDGLDCYRALAPDIVRLLAPYGIAALEIGMGQHDDVVAIMAGAGLSLREVRADLAGIGRCLLLARS
ncbi:MAG TPA: peptide chain release factor N(5)-glutamine methyltransferase [Candidatus Sulfotelmatobacter sp.]|jgi:release factor glutamine methyltransferase|nr:peptide chain release factor N(5)-glutamine methyltransferase [Candidatus Sulfotelmatobacter sp.]